MKTEKFLYEVLMRFGPEGLTGAHVMDLIRVTDDDGAVSDMAQPPRGVTEEELAGILGGDNAALLAASESAAAARERMKAERDAARKDYADAQKEINALLADRAALETRCRHAEGIGAAAAHWRS